jgi:SAM-dependent methyltransferase
MTDTNRETLRTTFGQDAELYDQCRPTYPPQLFTDLAALADLGSRSRVLEIGCGTGQATLPLAQLGCDVVAMDLSPDMAAIARRNLRMSPSSRRPSRTGSPRAEPSTRSSPRPRSIGLTPTFA